MACRGLQPGSRSEPPRIPNTGQVDFGGLSPSSVAWLRLSPPRQSRDAFAGSEPHTAACIVCECDERSMSPSVPKRSAGYMESIPCGPNRGNQHCRKFMERLGACLHFVAQTVSELVSFVYSLVTLSFEALFHLCNH